MESRIFSYPALILLISFYVAFRAFNVLPLECSMWRYWIQAGGRDIHCVVDSMWKIVKGHKN